MQGARWQGRRSPPWAPVQAVLNLLSEGLASPTSHPPTTLATRRTGGRIANFPPMVALDHQSIHIWSPDPNAGSGQSWGTRGGWTPAQAQKGALGERATLRAVTPLTCGDDSKDDSDHESDLSTASDMPGAFTRSYGLLRATDQLGLMQCKGGCPACWRALRPVPRCLKLGGGTACKQHCSPRTWGCGQFRPPLRGDGAGPGAHGE